MIAMDCEMVGVGFEGRRSVLARVSIVSDAERNGEEGWTGSEGGKGGPIRVRECAVSMLYSVGVSTVREGGR